MLTTTPDARDAFDTLAPFYDAFTAHHDYELWTSALLELARRHGVRGNRLLDAACGTGKSFEPFVRRGWRVTGCDLSPAMLARAAQKTGSAVELHTADLRELPRFGEFDLAVVLCDGINYITDPDALPRVFTGLASNLATGGLLLFDVNTLCSYRGFFSETVVIEADDAMFIWRGHGDDPQPGDAVEASFDAFSADGADTWVRRSARQRERHHPCDVVLGALGDAGLECVGVYGHGFDARPVPGVDEDRHTKAVYLARAARRGSREEVS